MPYHISWHAEDNVWDSRIEYPKPEESQKTGWSAYARPEFHGHCCILNINLTRNLCCFFSYLVFSFSMG